MFCCSELFVLETAFHSYSYNIQFFKHNDFFIQLQEVVAIHSQIAGFFFPLLGWLSILC